MNPITFDIVFVGGGLANGLAAYRLHQFRPDLRLLVLEAGPQMGGNHTWSFHQNDLNVKQRAWLSPFISKSWGSYEVHFPQFSRTVYASYFSIQSERFHRVLQKEINSFLRCGVNVSQIYRDGVILERGEKVMARCVIDGRGWEDDPKIPVGYQKFFGLDVTLRQPHGLNHPVLMDVWEPQKDGYRFFYLLPWSSNAVLVEDTRYSDVPELEEEQYRNEVLSYIEKKGWSVLSVNREEKGALPIPLSGQLKSWNSAVPVSGTRAGLFHATTGYSLPAAVQFADTLAILGRYNGESVRAWSKQYAKDHWEKEGFHRLLNRMMFRAAKPENRFKILQKFYRFPDDLISRFYSGKMSSIDHLRIFTGRPPVPVSKALRHIF